MKHKKKGRKIYTYHAKNRRVFSAYHPMRTAVGTVLTLLVIAALGFVGYNVVGPVVTRLAQEQEAPTTTPEPYFTEASEPETDEAVADAAIETTVTQATTVTTTAPETTTQPAETRLPADMEVSYLVPADALKDLDSIEAAAKQCAEKGYTAMILPLKTENGVLQYASGVEQAVTCGASNDSKLTLREITNAAKRYQISCFAQFSTLKDQTYSNYFMEGAYVFTDGATRWLDDKPEEGGKPWLNPFDEASGTYLSALTAEIDKSGFSGIICTDTVFPDFFQSDADLLGAHIMDPARRKEALLNLLNRIAADAPSAGLHLKLEDMISGQAEAFDAAALNMNTLYIEIDPDAITEAFTAGDRRFDPTTLEFWERIQLLAEAAQAAAAGRDVIPCLSLEILSETEIETAVKALQQIGCRQVAVF